MDHLHSLSDNYTAVEEFNLAEALMNGYDLLLMGEPSFVMTPLLCHRDITIHIPTANHTAIDLSPPWLLTRVSCYYRYVKLTLSSLYLGDPTPCFTFTHRTSMTTHFVYPSLPLLTFTNMSLSITIALCLNCILMTGIVILCDIS